MTTQYQDIDRAGNFRGEIVDYGLTEQESGAVAIGIEAHIYESWNSETKEWEDWREFCFRATGYIYVVKKDGTLNDKQVQSLVQCAGWDGSFDSISQHSWQPTKCQFVVNSDTYQNSTRYRINWVNDYDRAPGGMGQLSEDRVRQLNAKFAGPLRAIAGTAKKSPPVPNGTPKAPPAVREPVTAANTPRDEIPF